nr:beta-lactamase family protein [Agrococcus sp. KRD186]
MLEWGSITKTVTAALALRLEAAGALCRTDAVVTHLPESGLPASVTVSSLIAHTSGLPRVPAGIDDVFDPYAKYTTEAFDRDVVPTLGQQRQQPKPLPEYSNLGYAVLTRVLETAGGGSWWQLASEHVLKPLGLDDVAVDPPQERRPVVRGWNGEPRVPWTMHTGPFVGAGGLWGTFDALERCAPALVRKTADAGSPGWQVQGAVRWHNGHVRDSGAFVAVRPDAERVVTVHTLGRRAGTADRVARRITTR